jgi:hypothetical protein
MVRDELKQERRSRYNNYIERNALILLALYSFLLGVSSVSMVLIVVSRGEDPSPLALLDFATAMTSLGWFGSISLGAFEAFKALKRRDDSRG